MTIFVNKMNDLSAHIFEVNLNEVLRLLNEGADINQQGENGVRPIIAAVNSENVHALEFIIRHKADVDVDNGYPLREALDLAIDGMIQGELARPSQGSLKIIELLLQSGADLEIKDEQGRRPIDVVTLYSHNAKSFERLKSYFRPLIPNIDSLITRNE